MMRMDFSVQVALDFIECTKAQKENFIKHLELLNWKAINPNKLWVVDSSEENYSDLIYKIDQQIVDAKEYSKLYELDYFIISEKELYFNQLT